MQQQSAAPIAARSAVGNLLPPPSQQQQQPGLSSPAAAAGGAAGGAAAAGAAAAASGGDGGDPRFAKVGFAKLLGEGLEYHIQKYEIVMGRRSKVSVSCVSMCVCDCVVCLPVHSLVDMSVSSQCHKKVRHGVWVG